MTETSEQIAAQLAALRKARASGLRSIRHGTRELTYRSDAELRDAIRDLEDRLADAQGARRRRRRILTTSTTKGL